MTHEHSDNLAARLLAADPAGRPNSAGPDPWFERLLESEAHFERQVRRAALLSWALAFACLVALAVSFYLVRNGGGEIVEVGRAAALVLAGTGLVSLVAATASSLAWLLRSRTPTLRAIERRLAALERLLARR